LSIRKATRTMQRRFGAFLVGIPHDR